MEKLQDESNLIVVCGATGRQGGAVVRQLKSDGWRVKALTRNRHGAGAEKLRRDGIELVQGDLDDIGSLKTAFKGASGVFGVTDFWEHGYEAELRMGRNLIAAVNACDVDHFVFSSVGATERTEGLGITHFDGKREIERAIADSGLNATILKPVTFMDNMIGPRFRANICKKGKFQFGFNKRHKFQLIAMRDLGVFASLAFQKHPALYRKPSELASEAITMEDFSSKLSAAVGRPVRYVFLTRPMQQVIGFFISILGRQGKYKAGPSLVNQFSWNNEDGGWAADIEALKAIHPALMATDVWMQTIDWWEGLR